MEIFYQTTLAFIRQHKSFENAIVFMTKYLPYIFFILYPYIILYLYFSKSLHFYESIWKPLFAFLIVTIFRKIVNRPRPYDIYAIQPLVGHKHGESFPSRHTVSAFIIALVAFYVHVDLAIFAFILATIICSCRILCGVHFISDIMASIIIAVMIFLI